jgi:galactokinase/galacturonokinase
MAVDRSVMMVARVADGPVFEIESCDFDGTVTVDVTVQTPGSIGHWGDYVRAAVGALSSKYGLSRGLHAVICGELAGAGLSSSAAVLLAYLVGLGEANGIELGATELARLVQAAENTYIGVASGLLDQSVMIYADRGKLSLIDCRNFSVSQIESPAETVLPSVIVAFSGVRRSLADTGFNQRVGECRAAAKILMELAGRVVPAVPRLRDVPTEVFAAEGGRLPPALRSRARHFFTELERVALGADAWRSGDLDRFGALVSESGESSIVNYECGTRPLITLYELLRKREGVFGARFSGGGFGGSCIALARPDAASDVVSSISRAYAIEHPEFAPNADFKVCSAAGPIRIFGAGD